MNISSYRAFILLTISSLLISPQAIGDSLIDTIINGQVSANFRYRIETVDQNNALSNATASTIRSRLGYATGTYHNLSAYIEFEDTHTLFIDDYNSVVGGNPLYSVVADPVGTEVNQAFLQYTSSDTNTFKFGRQRILLDNVRFVGNVGWRQNEQTYDAFTLKNTSLNNTTITFSHITKVNRIFFTDLNMSNNILNIAYKFKDKGKLSVYNYMLEYDEAPTSSHQTIGARYSGGKNKFLYTVELAKQSDYQNGSPKDADYTLLELGLKVGNSGNIKLGLETLGSDNGISSFQTPLATLHAFNGWADQFLSTPANGLQDTYINYSTKVNGYKLMAVIHNFSADLGSADYGSEIDLLASKKFSKHFSGGIKYASYQADTVSIDTDKIWIWTQLGF